jgi:hypothetical protein
MNGYGEAEAAAPGEVARSLGFALSCLRLPECCTFPTIAQKSEAQLEIKLLPPESRNELPTTFSGGSSG